MANIKSNSDEKRTKISGTLIRRIGAVALVLNIIALFVNSGLPIQNNANTVFN